MSDTEIATEASTAPDGRRGGGGAVVIGLLIGFQDDGQTPLVLYHSQSGDAAVPARTVHDLQGTHIGCEVVLAFEDGNPGRPVVLGCLQKRATRVISPNGVLELERDGERLVIEAREQLVLRCGEASITLTKAGKVIIQGTYLSSRSTGVIRIKGGSVQLN